MVPTGSPSRVEDVVVYVFDINQPSLPTPFLFSFYVFFLSLWPFQLYFIPKFLPTTLLDASTLGVSFQGKKNKNIAFCFDKKN